jgi:hypothetical protein
MSERIKGPPGGPLVRIVRQRQDDPISIRELAKRLRVKQRDVLSACEDNDMCINVGIGIQGAGYAEHDNIGDYTIEDLNFDVNNLSGINATPNSAGEQKAGER